MISSKSGFLNVKIYILFQLAVFIVCLILIIANVKKLFPLRYKILLEPKTTVRSPANFCRH